MFDKLVQPASGIIEKGERILIAPDGPLHLLPFAAWSGKQLRMKRVGSISWNGSR